jgi:hypothetical protein
MNRTLAATLSALAVLAASQVDAADSPPARAPRMQLWVPAYFYPAGEGLADWDRLIAAVEKTPVIAVVNPGSGPGKQVDPNYTAVTRRARKAGVTLVGYVTVSYAKRPLADVTAEVDRWLDFYPTIQGFMLDEQPSGGEHVGYCVDVCKHIRGKLPEATILGNPGTVCAAEYVAKGALDAVCLYERNCGFAEFESPAWAKDAPAAKQGTIVYQVESAEKMADHVRDAARRRFGLVYFTDDTGSNPYDRLPTYWDAQVDAVAEINRRTSP